MLQPTWIKVSMAWNDRYALCSWGYRFGARELPESVKLGHSGVQGKGEPNLGQSPPRCSVGEVPAASHSQNHTCVWENLERELISSNRKRDHQWINIYATQMIKGPGNRTEREDKLLDSVVVFVTFIRVVVTSFGAWVHFSLYYSFDV